MRCPRRTWWILRVGTSTSPTVPTRSSSRRPFWTRVRPWCPWISIYEVIKRLLKEPNGDEAALHVVAAMQGGRVANLDAELAELALDAAKTFFETKLPMTDSVILATAHAYEATL